MYTWRGKADIVHLTKRKHSQNDSEQAKDLREKENQESLTVVSHL